MKDWKHLKAEMLCFCGMQFCEFLVVHGIFLLFSFAVSFVSYFSFSDQNGMDMTILQIRNYFHVCMYECMYIYICMYVCICICICICIFGCI